MDVHRKKLGEILVEEGVVAQTDVDAALDEQRCGEPGRLGDLLLARGLLTEAQLAKAMAKQHGVPFTELPAIPRAVIELVALDLQRQYRFVPLRASKGSLAIAIADLSHAGAELLPVLRRRFGSVQVFIAPADAIDAVHDGFSNAPTAEDALGSSGVASSPARVDVAPRSALEGVATADPSSPPRHQASAGTTGAFDDDEDSPFFEIASPSRISARLDDQAFVPGVPMSSPSSLAKLVMEPELPALTVVPPPDLNFSNLGTPRPFLRVPEIAPVRAPSAVERAAPEPVAVPRSPGSSPPSRITLPEWMTPQTPAKAGANDWSEALEALPPSKLIIAVAKALIKRGLLTEHDILSVDDDTRA